VLFVYEPFLPLDAGMDGHAEIEAMHAIARGLGGGMACETNG